MGSSHTQRHTFARNARTHARARSLLFLSELHVHPVKGAITSSHMCLLSPHATPPQRGDGLSESLTCDVPQTSSFFDYMGRTVHVNTTHTALSCRPHSLKGCRIKHGQFHRHTHTHTLCELRWATAALWPTTELTLKLFNDTLHFLASIFARHQSVSLCDLTDKISSV